MFLFRRRPIEKSEDLKMVDKFNEKLNELINLENYNSSKDYQALSIEYKDTYEHLITIKSSGLLKSYCKKNKITEDFVEKFFEQYQSLKEKIDNDICKNEDVPKIIIEEKEDTEEEKINEAKPVYEDVEEENIIETDNKTIIDNDDFYYDAQEETEVETKEDPKEDTESSKIEDYNPKDVINGICTCFKEINKMLSCGVSFLVHILKGSQSKNIIISRCDQLASYGIYKNFKNEYLVEIINILLDKEIFLKRSELIKDRFYPVLYLNPEKNINDLTESDIELVNNVLNKQIKSENKKNNVKDKAEVNKDTNTNYIKYNDFELSIDEDGTILTDIELLEALRKIRLNIANNLNIPAFYICSNKTLVIIATEKPINKESFLRVKGVGKVWFSKYGDEFIKEIIKYK